MLGLVSTPSATAPVDIIRAVLPIGIGLASAAFLTLKLANHGFAAYDSIPTVSIRPGDKAHDEEFYENPDLFLTKCEEQYGSMFNLHIYNQFLTVISGAHIREIFKTESLNFGDAADDVSGIHSFTMSITKAKRTFDDPLIHEIIRDNISPNLPWFTPRIVEQFQSILDTKLGHSQERNLVENPLLVIREMVASAMVTVFMGLEVAKNPSVIDSFIQCSYDLAGLTRGNPRKSRWRAFRNRTKYGLLNPLQKHIQVLAAAASPVIQERRKQEAEAVEKGVEYDRPLDILQKMLDSFDKYKLVDIEDVCGNLLLIVLVSVLTTSDASTYLCYYLASFPEYGETLYNEQREVLGQIAKEREGQRQRKLQSGEVDSARDFEGTDLDPKNDQDLSAAAVKRMVHLDSYVREMFRFRSQRLSLPHLAREDVVLSNGVVIRKGMKIILNMRSLHQDYDLQGEDPTEFRPWRFVGKSKAATKVATDFLVFGMGKHACPGRFLAIQEIKTICALIVSRYSKLELQDPTKKMKALLSRPGEAVPTGLYFTSRAAETTTDSAESSGDA
ncbi:hypothetical protein BGX28_007927 [Mortierella sp. GBA30]|nr:hypothetical protein BGX28_007927 [Mortierella sp. GBA30]